ncbi:DIE2/ALG10 family-domain-containing protein [Stachybotrys elegans]|uniref:Dol-P-Glc:Glc(2)Man(9)GlcNAc(2)-PP-Dol alpha-1,2-glucosyltransferase n=1 Tax=Stachybotrys elegans TaxID=80388 RepID=A0A8K0WNM5_9HYPO|nr:DIE2/ALG10 family-domain-containing protein [Stachybotrys elegans]
MDDHITQHEEPSTSILGLPSGLLAIIPLYVWAFAQLSDASKPLNWAFGGCLAAAAASWLRLVSAFVPEAYLDEFFHIPQAQKYCQGRFREWDDKITTPPGLYLISSFPRTLMRSIGAGADNVCDESTLRSLNTVGLLLLSLLAMLCRQQLEGLLQHGIPLANIGVRSQYSAHTALNIALFPVLFFFSGLYYTDVMSTVVVMLAFLLHLYRVSGRPNSVRSDISVVFLGLSSLLMRQTNVFWSVVFLGGLETAHAVKSLQPERAERPEITTLWGQLKYSAWRYSLGDVHDPPLNLAYIDDMFFCLASLALAAAFNPLRVARQIWPYIAVLLCFGAFVVWNGGVVLGDKSNHVATIHLTQMLYIWPFFAFFSLPMILPAVYSTLATVLSGQYKKLGRSNLEGTDVATSESSTTKAEPAKKRDLKSSNVLMLVNYLLENPFFVVIIPVLASILIALAIVRFNTIIHPFTLADNRHYMFYIFRYTIRRGQMVRLLLAIPYVICQRMVWSTLAGCCSQKPFAALIRDNKSGTPLVKETRPSINRPVWVPGQPEQTYDETPELEEIRAALKEEKSYAWVLKQAYGKKPLRFSTPAVATSTGLIFMLATALSLITAPLVEPRYFIIPWVIWRLLLPAWWPHDHGFLSPRISAAFRSSWMGHIFAPFEAYDPRLILETVWLVAVNLVTGYIFLYHPYVWKSEDGSVLDGGRLQRFMW